MQSQRKQHRSAILRNHAHSAPDGGREVSRLRDDGGAPPVAVIGESVARGLFPGRSPLGQRIAIGQESMEIVGVVKDTRYQSLREPAQPMVYRPYVQMRGTWEELFFGIRTAGDPDKIGVSLDAPRASRNRAQRPGLPR